LSVGLSVEAEVAVGRHGETLAQGGGAK